MFSSAGAGLLAVGYLLPLLYLIWSLRYGARASANPWDARGLEAILPAIHKRPGPFFAVVKVHARPTPRVPVPNDGTYMQHRFRGALLGARAFE